MKAALHAEARELGIAGPGEHAAARHEQQSVPSHPLQPPPRVPPRHGGFNSSAGAKHGSAGAGVTGGKLSRNSSSGQWVDLELGGTSIR